MYTKNIAEWPEESSLRRPICDSKDDIGERPEIVVLQSLPKILSSAVRIIPEGATAPCAENERGVSVRACDGEHAMHPLPQEVSGLRLTNGRHIRGSTASRQTT